jgi:predicted lipoprotein with Yx(FWY)xxD motif
LGAILVGADGRALYLYGRDAPGRSLCSGACTRVWPPATVAGRPSAGPGVAAGKLGEIRRTDRRLQLTYGEHPLYTFSGDTAAGQTGGEGFLGTWFLVSPLGRKIVVAGAPAAPAGY